MTTTLHRKRMPDFGGLPVCCLGLVDRFLREAGSGLINCSRYTLTSPRTESPIEPRQFRRLQYHTVHCITLRSLCVVATLYPNIR